MNFIDQAKITIKSGKGGDGCVSFRREKFIEFGGPNGGNGGKGGNIFAVATSRLNSLLDFKYRQHFFAKAGRSGAGQDKTGASGDDLVIPFPLGTQLYEEDGETLIIDLVNEDEKYLLAKGGNGGFGNAHFKSSVNQAPTNANPGQPAEERIVFLKLKLMADVGLVGLPNAGKSTFLSVVSAARPKIASYPFTTLAPKLGVVKYKNFTPFIIADIPGLIKDAHKNIGLGIQFLGHIERCKLLLFIIDANGNDPLKDYNLLLHELAEYTQELSKKDYVVAMNKSDLCTPQQTQAILTSFNKQYPNLKLLFFSGLTKNNLESILDTLIEKLANNLILLD